jgi:hypothetical protein
MVVEEVGKKQLQDFKKYLEVEIAGNLDDDTDVIMPSVRYQVK